MLAATSDSDPTRYDPDFTLLRYNGADGSLDTTFGVGGKVTTDIGAYDIAAGVAIQSDGKIVLAGSSLPWDAQERDTVLARYDSDGNLNPFMDLYLEAGITGLAPCEVAAGMDPVALRAKYGRRLRLFGGIDKDYNTPRDTWDKLIPSKVEKVARLAFLTALEVANREARPRFQSRHEPEAWPLPKLGDR